MLETRKLGATSRFRNKARNEGIYYRPRRPSTPGGQNEKEAANENYWLDKLSLWASSLPPPPAKLSIFITLEVMGRGVLGLLAGPPSLCGGVPSALGKIREGKQGGLIEVHGPWTEIKDGL